MRKTFFPSRQEAQEPQPEGCGKEQLLLIATDLARYETQVAKCGEYNSYCYECMVKHSEARTKETSKANLLLAVAKLAYRR